MPAKLERCVKRVKASGKKVNPYAVCTKSLQRSGYLKPGTNKRK